MRVAPLLRILLAVALAVVTVMVVMSKRSHTLSPGDALVIRNASTTAVTATLQSPDGTIEHLPLPAGGTARGRFQPGMTIHVFLGEAKGMSAGSWTITSLAGPLDIDVDGADMAVGISGEGLASRDADTLHINAR